MNKTGILLAVWLLTGCQAPSPGHSEETVSPTDYQECIQAAKSGNGAESEALCNKVMQDTR